MNFLQLAKEICVDPYRTEPTMTNAAEHINYTGSTDPVTVLEEVEDYLLLEFDRLYDASSKDDGTIPDLKDAEDLEALDGLIDRVCAARQRLREAV